MGDDRPIRYVEEDGTIVYRASALGTCERAFVACANGVPAADKPEWFKEVLNEGTRAEPIISGLWELKTGYDTASKQHEYDLRIGKVGDVQVVVRCHIDGERDWGGPGIPTTLREYKKFRDSTWPKFLTQGVECGPNYPWQVSVCMLAGDFDECEFVGGHAVFDDWGVMTISEVEHHLLTAPPLSFKAIRDRVKRIERFIQAGFDAREVDCNQSMYPCPYYKAVHDEPDEPYELPATDEAGGLARQYISQMALLSSEIRMLKEKVKEAEQRKKAVSDGFRGCLEVFGPEAMTAKKMLTDEYEIAHVTGGVQERIAKGYDLDYFKVTVRKGKK